jgi:hypothetical protein
MKKLLELPPKSFNRDKYSEIKLEDKIFCLGIKINEIIQHINGKKEKRVTVEEVLNMLK